LEDALLDLSKRLGSLGLPTSIQSSADLDAIIPHIKSTIDELRLWEYYVFDVQASVKTIAKALEAGSAEQWKGESLNNKSTEDLAQIAKNTPGLLQNFRAWSGRYCSKADTDIAAGFMKSTYPDQGNNELASRWGKILDVINVDLYAECNDDVKAALDGIIGRLRFNRLEEHGPKLGAVTEE
jgi:glycogen debranching enzyme